MCALKAAAIGLGAWFAMGPVVHGGWIWDDGLEVTANGLLRGTEGLQRIWFGSPGLDYFPLKTTLQWVEWQLWGYHPAGYHAVNLALHAVGALLLWRVLAALGVRQAWFGGLLFAVHPLAAESVAWVSELKNVLSLPLMLLSFLAYLRWDALRNDEGGNLKPENKTAFKFQLSAFIFFLASMLSKSSVVMFPFVLLLHAWWKRGTVTKRDLAAAAPFFGVSLILGLVTLSFQEHRAIVGVTLFSDGFFVRLAAAGQSVIFYASNALWPSGLLPIYPRWEPKPLTPLDYWGWVVMAAVLVPLWRRRPEPGARAVLLASGFFLLNLVPVLGFLPMAYLRISRVADHFAYLSLAGAAGLGAVGFGWLLGRNRTTGWLAALLAVAALMVECRAHAALYRDEKTLWSHEVRHNADAWLAWNNLGIELHKEKRLAEAVSCYRRALALRPDFAEAHNNLGMALFDSGRLGEAYGEFERALTDKPELADAYNNEGNLFLKLDRLPEAVERYERALRIDPDSTAAHNDLGNALTRQGRLSEAMDQYRLALRMNPEFPEAHSNLGAALARVGRSEEAVEEYRRLLQLRPDFAEAHNNLGVALEGMGRLGEAREEYRAALRLQPSMEEPKSNLGRVERKLAAAGAGDEGGGR
jgi:protein O-mannosyl-transferase